MINRPITFISLRNIFVRLYYDVDNARRITDDAGINTEKVNFNTGAVNFWHSILADAVNKDQIEPLLNVAVNEYKGNQELLAAYNAYCHLTRSGKRLTSPPPPGTTKEEQRNYNNHKIMRQLVQNQWIDGVLNCSLLSNIQMRLKLEVQTAGSDNPFWNLNPKQKENSLQLVPPDKTIVDVFDELNQFLLILGGPGSGKTIAVLQLADNLLQRAQNEYSYPTPVVLNLSSWAYRRGNLETWLLNEFQSQYNIPNNVVRDWLNNNELILLLDGLDEVQEGYREACVNAINAFHQHYMVSLVVSSREIEYQHLSAKLRSQGTISLQPLTRDQIDTFLHEANVDESIIQFLFEQNSEHLKFIESPLILNMVALSIQRVPYTQTKIFSSIQSYQKYLFEIYITCMLMHQGVELIYSPRSTLEWLRWLSIQLMRYSQSIFYIEKMQLGWLQSNTWENITALIVKIIWSPIYGISAGLIFGLSSGLFFGVIAGLFDSWLYNQSTEFIVWIFIGLLFGLVSAIIYGLIYGLIIGILAVLSGQLGVIELDAQLFEKTKRIKHSLYPLFFWAAIGALIGGLIDILTVGLTEGLIEGLTDGIIYGMIGGLVGGFSRVRLIDQTSRSQTQIHSEISRLMFGLSTGLKVGLGAGIADSILGGGDSLITKFSEILQSNNPNIFQKLLTMFNGLPGGLADGLIYGLIGGTLFGLFFEQHFRSDIPISALRQTPNQGIKTAVKSFLSIGLTFGVVFGLLNGLTIGFFTYVSVPVSISLYDTSIDILLGLFSAVYLGAVAGMIGGVIGNGDSIVKHLILRFALWKKRYAPMNYARFLEYSVKRIFLRHVGGGYIFSHRLLMEHFANMTDNDIKRISASVDQSTYKQ